MSMSFPLFVNVNNQKQLRVERKASFGVLCRRLFFSPRLCSITASRVSAPD